MQDPTSRLRWFVGKIAGVRPEHIIFALVTALVVYLVVTPLGLQIFCSFKLTPQGGLPFDPQFPFSIANYINVYLNPLTYQLFRNTLTFAAGSLIIGLSLALIFAWLTERTNIPFRNVLYVLMIIPMAIPGMLAAISYVFLLTPRQGLLNIILRAIFGLSGEGPFNIYTLYGMVIVESIRMVPTLYLMMLASFRTMDPSLEEASYVAGASLLTTIRRITLPILSPAILAALIYQFISAIEAFEIPGVIGLSAGVPVFSTWIYYLTHPAGGGLPDYGTATTLSMFVLALSFTCIYLYGRFTKKAERFAVVTGKAYRPRIIDLGRWRYLAIGGVLLYALLAVILPLFILFWGSLFTNYRPPSLEAVSQASLDGYFQIFQIGQIRNALSNTLIISLMTGTVTVFIVSIISWVIVRSQIRGKGILDMLTFAPHAIPGVVLGLAIMLLYLFMPIPIYGTIWIIVVALITKYLAFPSRALNAAQMQIHKELEEASAVSGASWWKTFLSVNLPLLTPAIINSWIWVVVGSLRELSAALMLYSPKSVVLSTLIWSRWNNGDIQTACALGVVLTIILAILTFGGRYYLVKRVKLY